MKIKIKKKRSIDVAESGALSDLAFLLIIFFIVIAVFNINRGFILSLPQKSSSKIVNVEDIIKVKLMDDNKLYYKDNAITLDELEKTVTDRLEQRPNMTFLLKVHPEATYQEVVKIVDIIRKREVVNFSFSMLEVE